MNRHRLNRVILFCILSVFFSAKAWAQPTLPDIIGVTQNGLNILSWTCQYDGIKSIAVQRSADSVYNFASIGYVKNLAKGPQAYIDGHPNPGKNWYRLYIVFNSDLTWYSNRIKIVVDSNDILKQKLVISNDSLQKLASRVKVIDTSRAANPATAGNTSASGTKPAATTPTTPPKPVITLAIPDASAVNDYTYIKSEYVFTNPFTGHVNVEIKDSKAHNYSIIFYDQKNLPVLEVPRIPEPSIIIDKRNFQRKGVYKFELLKNKERVELGYITIY